MDTELVKALEKISLESSSDSVGVSVFLGPEDFETDLDYARYIILTNPCQQKKDEASESLCMNKYKQDPLIFSRSVNPKKLEKKEGSHKKITISEGEYSPFPRSNSGGSSSPTMMKLRRSSQPIPVTSLEANEQSPLAKKQISESTLNLTTRNYTIF